MLGCLKNNDIWTFATENILDDKIEKSNTYKL